MSIRRWSAAATAGLFFGLVPIVPAHAGASVAGKDSADSETTSVWVKNRYQHQITIVVATKDPSCDEWLLTGWWNVDSGDSEHITNVDNGVFLYYAYSSVDDHTWSGSVLDVDVPMNRFATCDKYLHNGGDNTRAIGMRLKTFTPGGDSFTFTLVP